MNLLQELFPGRLQRQLICLEKYISVIEEIRLRVNMPLIIRMRGEEYAITKDGQLTIHILEGMRLNSRDMEECLQHICHSSLYAYEEDVRRGYITIEGGHRVGVAGQAVLDENAQIKTVKNVSFLNIRIAHEIKNAANEILPYLYTNGIRQNLKNDKRKILNQDKAEKNRIYNTLIISPPGFGKTTLLRDLIRQISDGNVYGEGKNCSVIDERSEIAGSFRGIPQLDVGIRTDVLDGCPKAVGMMMAIRAMGPQVVAVDELGSEEDIEAVLSVIRSGCCIIATIHGDGMESAYEKSYLKQVIDEKIFGRYIVIADKERKTLVYNEEFQIVGRERKIYDT